MKRLYVLALTVLAVIFVFQTTPAVKPEPQRDFNRTLSIKGTDFDKRAYSGTLEVKSRKMKSPNPDIEGVTLKWNIGGDVYEGIGVVTSDILTATWGGKSCSLVVYSYSGKKLEGIWTVIGQSGLGSEFANGTNSKDITGSYTVQGTNLNGSPYKGTLQVAAQGPVYQFSWNTGVQYEGIGIRTGPLVSVAYGADAKDKCGVVQYEITDSGLANGKWGIYGNNALGSEQGTLK